MAADPRSLAEFAYGEAVHAVREAARWPDPAAPFVQERLGAAARELQAVLESPNAQALLILTARSGAGSYLYVHSANVAILAMRVAAGLGASAAAVRELGASGLGLDLRRGAALGIRPESESAERRLHPLDGAQIFEHLSEMEAALPESLRELSPQPPETDPDPEAQRRRPEHQGAHILALCDLYESLSHPRPWRDGWLPHDALISMLKRHRRQSDQGMVKAFTQNLSLYPPGSYLELSSNELARVVEIHPESPTRPTVEVFARSDGQSLPARTIRLLDAPHVNIVRPMDEARLPLRELRQRLAVAASRWWTGE